MDLTTLEPIAGAGFAMSLAYLALDRFRYREVLEKAARDALSTLDTEGDGTPDPPLQIENNDQYLELKWLAHIDCNGFKPTTPWFHVYDWVYRDEDDVFFVSIFAFLSAFLLVVGVARGIMLWPIFEFLNKPILLTAGFYACVIAIVMPPVLVKLGRHIMELGKQRASHLEGQINDVLKLRVPATRRPRLPRNGRAKAAPQKSSNGGRAV